MWHVSSRSGVATLRTAIHLLLTYLLTSSYGCNKYTIYIVYFHLTFIIICLTRSWLPSYCYSVRILFTRWFYSPIRIVCQLGDSRQQRRCIHWISYWMVHVIDTQISMWSFPELDYFFLLSAGNFSLHQQQHGGNRMFGYRQESHAECRRYLHVIYTVFHKNGDTILMVISLSNFKPHSFSGWFSSEFAVKWFF